MSSDTALLIVDMINTFDFPRGRPLRQAALAVAPRIARLKRRVDEAGGRCIYVNDNFAGWNVDFHALVSLALDSPGREVVEPLAPSSCDWHLLKGRHSAFHQTPLQTVLQEHGIGRVLVCGLSTESCVLATALDAHIHHFEVAVVSDCVASSSAARRSSALAVLRYGAIPVMSAARALGARRGR